MANNARDSTAQCSMSLPKQTCQLSPSPGTDIYQILSSALAQSLLVRNPTPQLAAIILSHLQDDWVEFIKRRAIVLLSESEDSPATVHGLVSIGTAAFNAFLQANVTGPPLPWSSADLILPGEIFRDTSVTRGKLQNRLIQDLSVDGEAVYKLLPCVELFSLAKCLLNQYGPPRERLRLNVWHQRLLNDLSPSLQDVIYHDLESLEESPVTKKTGNEESGADLIERASIHLLYGFEAKAQADLEQAARARHFQYALTGRLGKRTKFQEKEISQLVVLAKSAEWGENSIVENTERTTTSGRPEILNLNDDTLLERISFSKPADSSTEMYPDGEVPPSLSSLDAGKQPLLEPLDAIILLAIASSISNTSAEDGLTREETLPYAERVISGGSSNWQVYTQALIIRSRIEGYRTRTVERGVLQLQAVVDQVIADTTSFEPSTNDPTVNEAQKPSTSTFLLKSKDSESAPASERLRFIHQLASPTRWKLEAELAQRWVSLGGLRTALEIYERLQMWAEVALCCAASDKENKARKIIRRQLYNRVITTSTGKLLDDDEDNDVGEYRIERDPLPADAPRLFCILGDLEKSVSKYERAWEISNHRYARAQRSLGKHYLASNDPSKADEAYSMSLRVNPQNHAIWFALGSVRLQLENWSGAVDAFGRAIKVDDTDAESWSNLAIALLKSSEKTETEQEMRIRESFIALRRAATLKRDSFRIWQNLLTISVRLSPPPYVDIVVAQTRLIEILGSVKGEKCIDVPIVEALLSHIIAESSHNTTEQPEDGEKAPRRGLEKMVVDLIQKKITPLITSSRRLWLLTAKLSLHLQRPLAALNAYEKAWRTTLNKPGWDTASDTKARDLWKEVADATIDLLDAYESLGERAREPGMGEGDLVCKDWKFKARSAARSVLARAKEVWEDDRGYEMLNERLQELKMT